MALQDAADDGVLGVGPWVDEHLGPASQLLLQLVQRQAEGLSAEELHICLIATWRGWLAERQVVREIMQSLDVDLEVSLPVGLQPRAVLAVEAGE